MSGIRIVSKIQIQSRKPYNNNGTFYSANFCGVWEMISNLEPFIPTPGLVMFLGVLEAGPRLDPPDVCQISDTTGVATQGGRWPLTTPCPVWGDSSRSGRGECPRDRRCHCVIPFLSTCRLLTSSVCST